MNREKLITYAWSLALLLGFGLAWELLPAWFGVPAFVLPPPSQVWSEFLRLWGAERLLWHAGITAFEVVVGFVLGSLLGAAIGYALGMSPRVEAVLSPYLLAL